MVPPQPSKKRRHPTSSRATTWTERAKKSTSRRDSALASTALKRFLVDAIPDRREGPVRELYLSLERSRAGPPLDSLRLETALAPQHVVEGAVEVGRVPSQVLLAQLR